MPIENSSARFYLLCQSLKCKHCSQTLKAFLLGLILEGSDSLHILVLLALSLFLNTKKKCACGWHRVLCSFSCYTVQPLLSNIIHFLSPGHPGHPLPPGKPHFASVYRNTTNTKPSPTALRATEQRSPHRARGRKPEDGFYPKTEDRDTAVP